MSKRKTPEDLAREADRLREKADRLTLLQQGRDLLDALKSGLRDAERKASKLEGDAAQDAFAPALASVDELRSVVGKLAGVDPLP